MYSFTSISSIIVSCWCATSVHSFTMHPGCVGLTVTESEILQRYKCPKCIDDGNDELLYDESMSIPATK